MTGVPHMVDSVFLALSVLTIGSAIVALEIRSLIYGSIALMLTLSGIAGFFLLLDAPFVAMFQLSVYVGSIAVLILFTVMLVRRDLIFNKVEDKRRRYAGIGLMIVLMLGIGTIIIGSGLKTVDTNSSAIDYKKIGEDFLTYYSPALIVMALILASSIIGAMTLARREDVIDDQRAD
jgi:NADH:ubiquinone oxidoreductase subunit 6 (subunit J)